MFKVSQLAAGPSTQLAPPSSSIKDDKDAMIAAFNVLDPLEPEVSFKMSWITTIWGVQVAT